MATDSKSQGNTRTLFHSIKIADTNVKYRDRNLQIRIQSRNSSEKFCPYVLIGLVIPTQYLK